MKKNTFHSTKLLTAGSLLMLLTFLVYWNVKNYTSQKEEMLYDINDQLHLALGEYNDSIFIAILENIDEEPGQVTSRFLQHFPELQLSDSAHSIVGIESEIHTEIHSGADSIRVFMTSRTTDTEENGLPGFTKEKSIRRWTKSNKLLTHDTFTEEHVGSRSLSFEAETGAGKKIIDLETTSIFSRKYNDRVEERFIERLDSLGLPSDFQANVVEAEDCDMVVKGSFPERLEFFSDNHQTQFYNYRPYLLGKILPSILMSSALFSFVGLSFFFLFNAWRKQEQLVMLKNDFISNMTHELKTPIATVGVALEALSRYGVSEDKEKRAEYIDISKHELNRLNILVDKVLKMSAFGGNDNVMNFAELDLKALVQSTLNSMKLHFEKYQVETTFDFEDADYRISGDKVHLTNVLYNLIDNAIKYSDKDPKINIRLRTSNEQIEISIADNGIGIPQKYLSKVFDRFFRVPTGDTHDVKGYGLGLNYVQDVIEKHQGVLELDSIEKVGTEIKIKLPR